MDFRRARPEEIEAILIDGYKEWPKNRTLNEYIRDNRSEDAFGTRFVVTVQDKIVSSLILLRLGEYNNISVYGIGSVLTPVDQRGNGYAYALLNESIKTLASQESIVFLYSDVSPKFYERLGFVVLPKSFQLTEKSICMVKCSQSIFEEILNSKGEMIPDQF